MNSDSFRNAANALGKMALSNEELLEAIQVHQCLEAYFHTRGEPLITWVMRMNLETLEGIARARERKG